MKLRYKLLDPRAKAPYHGSDGSGGYDLYALGAYHIPAYHLIWYRTGIAVEIPEGYTGLVCPRSSCWKKGCVPHMSPTVVDSDYRGEIWVCFHQLPNDPVPLPDEDAGTMGSVDVVIDSSHGTHWSVCRTIAATLSGPFAGTEQEPAVRVPYHPGERIAQLLVVPALFGAGLELEEVNELELTKRNAGGFGSTGAK